jgi:hypothetical protein
MFYLHFFLAEVFAWSLEQRDAKLKNLGLPPRETPDGWTDDTLSHVSVSTFFVAGTKQDRFGRFIRDNDAENLNFESHMAEQN